MIKIDKNIPIPERTKATKYPWREMKVGDSFFIPNKTYDQGSKIADGRKGVKSDTNTYTVRKVDGGVRIWRTK